MEYAYGQHYERLYREHWWWRAREATVLAELRRVVPPGGWSRALDIGCGNGLFFPALAELAGSIEGLEPDERLVSEPDHQRGCIHVRPFDSSFQPGHRYGLIVMLDVLEHLPDPEGALRHAAELLEPEGHILLTVPALQALWTRHDDVNHHFTRYSKRTLRAQTAHAGLQEVRCRYLYQWLVPVKLGVRVLEALTPDVPDPAPPRVPPGPLNGLFRGVSSVEHRLARALPFPMGSSLMFLGRPRSG